MNSIIMLALFAAFGFVCGLYLSVVGFSVTTIVVYALVGLVSAAFGGPFTPLMLVAAFVCQQVGFFLAVIGLAAREAYQRHHVRGTASEAALPVEREQSR